MGKSKGTSRTGHVAVVGCALVMMASGPAGCQGGEASISARVDPLNASEAEMSAEVERDVDDIESARGRMERRMELVDELIHARAAADGRLPEPGAPPEEWERYAVTYAPLRSALLDEMIGDDERQAIAEENAAFFRARTPSADDERLAREASRTLGAHVVTDEVAR